MYATTKPVEIIDLPVREFAKHDVLYMMWVLHDAVTTAETEGKRQLDECMILVYHVLHVYFQKYCSSIQKKVTKPRLEGKILWSFVNIEFTRVRDS